MKYDKEAGYWGDCYSEVAFGETCKQRMYMPAMGLTAVDGMIDLQHKSVIDIGGGPVSMLLRCFNATNLLVIDPIDWPESVKRRYANYGIKVLQCGGESQQVAYLQVADEVWIYNCLQHVFNPIEVLKTAKNLGKKIRIFEWLFTAPDECHPHTLTPELLLNGLRGTMIEQISIRRYTDFNCNCDALAGVFVCES